MARLTKKDLVTDLERVGVGRGDILNVKASLRSIGSIDGGADTLIDALLEVIGPGGTLVTDSFVTAYSPLSFDFWRTIVDQRTPSYAGALANCMIERSNVFRSFHPIQKFALIGSRAEELARQHDEDSYGYDVLKRMAKIGGKNLKLGPDEKVPGVGTSHVAIGIAKFRQKRKILGVRFFNSQGEKKLFFINWSGGCVQAFYNLNSLYEAQPGAILGRGMVGSAQAKLTCMKTTLDAELELAKTKPKQFLTCSNSECLDCLFSWEHHTSPWLPFAFRMLLKKEFRKILRSLKILLLYRYPF